MGHKESIFPQGTFYEKMFYYLWKHPSEMERKSFQINMPETVLFKNGMINCWYFTDKQGQIRRKKTENITLNNIFEAMTREIPAD